MSRHAKSTPAFLSIKLIPMLLLIQWVGLIGGTGVLNAMKSWAAVKTSSSSTEISASASPVATKASGATPASDNAVVKESTSTNREVVVDSFASASTRAKDLLASDINQPTRTILAQATQTTSTPAATAESSDLTTQSDIDPTSTSTSTTAEKSATTRKSSKNYSNTYIDSTDYGIGATQPKRKSSADRPSIVFSERSTGCQAVLSAGQGVASGLCESRPKRVSGAAIASSNPASSVMGSKSLKSGGLSRSRLITTRNLTRSVSPNYVIGSLNRVPTRSGSPGAVYGSFGTSFSNYSNIKIPKWFVPSNTRILFPLAIPSAITSAFGWRLHPISGTWRFHSGTDLGAPMGTPVLAAFAGNVAIADVLGGYGLAVVLDHNKGTQESLYAHLSEITVKPGMQVKQGDVIGLVGSTGNSTGPHLHFEVRQSTPQGWIAVDPGQQLETALAQLVQALQTAQASNPRSGT